MATARLTMVLTDNEVVVLGMALGAATRYFSDNPDRYTEEQRRVWLEALNSLHEKINAGFQDAPPPPPTP